MLAVVGIPLAVVNSALTPVLLESVPATYLGRVIAVITPIQQVASIAGVAVAGWLASTALRSFHTTVLGIDFGPIDTIFTLAGLLIAAGGLYAAASLRDPVPPRQQAVNVSVGDS